MTFAWTGKINETAAGFFAIDYTNKDGSKARMLVTQFEAADAIWQRLQALDPDHPGIVTGRAVCLYNLDRREEALAMLEARRAERIDEDDVLQELLMQRLALRSPAAMLPPSLSPAS